MDVWNPTITAITNDGTPVCVRVHRRGKKNITYYLHREIVDCPRGMQVDHKDNNPLNNHRENLAIVTPAENKALACIRRRWRIRYEGPKS